MYTFIIVYRTDEINKVQYIDKHNKVYYTKKKLVLYD